MLSTSGIGTTPAPVINLYEPVGHSRWNHLFGDETLLTVANAMQAKGNLVRSRSRYLLDTFGKAGFDAVAARLTGESLSYLVTPPLAGSWCSYKSLCEVDCMIGTVAMGGNIALMKPFGFAVATYDIPSVYKALYHLTSPSRLLQLITLAWGLYLRPGKLQVEIVSSSTARVMMSGSVVGRYLCEVGICGWMEATMGFSGAREPRCDHTRCRHRKDPVCEWRVTWT
jgi:hypothetical protein